MIIGISGKAQSGKDTVGKIVQYLTSTKFQSPLFQKDTHIKTECSWELFTEYNWNILNSDWQIKKFATKVKQILSLLTGIPVEDFEKEEVKSSYLGEEWDYVMIGDTLCTVQDLYDYASGTTYIPKNSDIQKMTIRQAMQLIGTDLFRDKFHPNTWVNALFAEYKLDYGCNEKCQNDIDALNKGDHCVHPKYCQNAKYPNWIITDVRFPNEAQAILDKGGILIRVNRKLVVGGDDYGYTKVSVNQAEKDGIIKPQHESEIALDSYDKFHYVIDNDGTIKELIEKVREILIKEKLV